MGLTIIEAETLSVEEALNREVIRKLRLATEAETKEDREIICEELFCDITGTLDANSQERLARCATASARRLPSLSAAARGGGAASCSSGDLAVGAAEQPLAFYEVLARFYERSRDAGEAVAHLCQRLWGQGYAAPIFTLLLHRWLLLGRPPGSSGGGAAGPVRGGAPGAGAGSSALGSDSAAGLGAGGSRAGGGASGAAGAPQPAADRTPEQERRWGRGSQERERPPELASAGESAAATASGAVATDAGGGGPPSEPPGSGGALGSSGALTRLRQLLSPAHSAPSGGDGGAAGGAAEGAPDASALSAREQQQEGVAAAAGAGGAGAQPGASGGGAAAAGQMVPLTSRLPLPPLPLPQRVKEASVLCMGARQLFMGDVHAGTERFAALYRCLEREVAMGPGLPLLAGLPLSTRTDVLAVIACVLPYYARPADMLALVARFPPPAAAAAARRAQLQHLRLRQSPLHAVR
ncbi:hypothetical protein FOA52_013554 [Chlamydomonas sp. UWO 241]|nr:hypothetical protein FOA52_013554 [Chlamydomonas sp. UWO 241]